MQNNLLSFVVLTATPFNRSQAILDPASKLWAVCCVQTETPEQAIALSLNRTHYGHAIAVPGRLATTTDGRHWAARFYNHQQNQLV